MNRRQFMATLGASVGWPSMAAAQQDRKPTVGVLSNVPLGDPEGVARIRGLERGLREQGWALDSIRMELRSSFGTAEIAQAHAQELVALQPDVVLAAGTLSLRSVMRATTAIPIVFVTVSDPVGDGFVESLARPGGNITGFSQYEYTIGGKWLGLLKEIAPQVSRVLLLMNTDNPASSNHVRTIESVASEFKVEVSSVGVHDTASAERALGTFRGPEGRGLIVLPGTANVVDRGRLVAWAEQARLPAVHTLRADALAGGLLSYGVDPVDHHRQAASYISRILKGEKPSGLPVQQPVNYQLVINLKAARALGIEVPPTLSARADEVIE
jgi:putative ABC transport system substrate-binding protein